MNKVKYIVIEGSYREMIIFGDTRQHVDVANKFLNDYNKIVSAGFLNICQGFDIAGHPIVSVQAYGESISLNVKSDPERDTKLAKRTLDLED